ncbi:hypothetical protein BC829DRAFT_148195 [Chytridium lagenaria]|nr:hypothetical protein BC829DRAFT_148195 [Chytridium lagenaria]
MDFLLHRIRAQTSYVPPFALKPGYQSALGTIMQNMACSIFVPSWINLKRRNVNAQSTVWTAMLIAVLLYLSFGNISALAYDIPDSGNIIQPSPSTVSLVSLSTATCYAFAFIMLLPSIPVSFIVAENNLTQNKVCPRFVAVFMCYILPWFAAMPLQTGDKLGIFLSWSGLLFVSTANFVIPFFIYLQCLRFRKVYNEKRILSDKQKWLLKTIHTLPIPLPTLSTTTLKAPVRRGGLRGATVVKRSLRRPSTRASQTPTLRRRITGTPGNDIPAEPDHDAYPRKPVRPRPGNQKKRVSYGGGGGRSRSC